MGFLNRLFKLGQGPSENDNENTNIEIPPISELNTEPSELEPITEDFSSQDTPDNLASNSEVPPKYDNSPPPEYDNPSPNPEVNQDQTDKSRQKNDKSR